MPDSTQFMWVLKSSWIWHNMNRVLEKFLNEHRKQKVLEKFWTFAKMFSINLTHQIQVSVWSVKGIVSNKKHLKWNELSSSLKHQPFALFWLSYVTRLLYVLEKIYCVFVWLNDYCRTVQPQSVSCQYVVFQSLYFADGIVWYFQHDGGSKRGVMGGSGRLLCGRPRKLLLSAGR